MSPWLEWGIPVITWLQNLGDWLIVPMRIITFLGDEEFYLLMIPLLLWCFDVGMALRVGLIYLFSGGLNITLKLFLGSPRPYWVSHQVRALATATDFGLPSGHAQNSLAVWGRLAASIRRPWGYLASSLIIVLIAFSRIYLAVHFPTDVLLGLLIGALLLLLFLKLEKPLGERLSQMSVGGQILMVLFASLLLLGLGWGASLVTAGRAVPSAWVMTAATAAPEAEPINPRDLKNFIAAAGALLGIGAGVACLFSWGGFNPGGPWVKRVGRYVVGVIGIVALYFGLKLIFPDGETRIVHLLRYIRYAVVGFWAAYLAPRLFVATGLA